MFCVIYKFEVKPGMNQKFIMAWEKMTQLIYKNLDSLGSKLHKESENVYIAYAKWPSKNHFNKARNTQNIEIEGQGVVMKSYCFSTSILHELEEVKGLLN